MEARRHPPSGGFEDDAAQPASAVRVTFLAFVAGTFLFGWVAGLLLVIKAWHLANATGWMMVSGGGYISLMLGPIVAGFCCARVAGRLVSRGWGGLPLRALALGVCGLVAGLMAV